MTNQELQNQDLKDSIESLTKSFIRLVSRVTELEISNESLKDRIAELEGKAERSKAFKKPSENDVMNYAIGKGIDTFKAAELGQKFCSFYESKGWMIGKNKMKNWQSAVATWLKTGQFNTQDKSEQLKNKWL